MTAPSHLAFAATSGLILTSFTSSIGARPRLLSIDGMLGVLLLAIGALLPDADSPNSIISRLVPPLRHLHQYSSHFSHRALLHSLLGLLATTAVLSVPFLLVASISAVFSVRISSFPLSCFATAYLSHLIADALTVRGIRFLYPYPVAFAYPSVDRYRLRTGEPKHELIFTSVSIIIGLLYLPILLYGGATGALHHVMADVRTAYEDYRELVGQEVLLEFEGFYASSKKPVASQALVLEAAPHGFKVFFQNQVITIGETSGKIIATAARCIPTDQPISITSLTLTHQSWKEIVPRFPAQALTSGELVADIPFLLKGTPSASATAITDSGNPLLRLTHALPRELSRLHVLPRTNQEKLLAEIESLQGARQRIASKLDTTLAAHQHEQNAYERDMLFSKITALRKEQTTLTAQIERSERELQAAQELRVHFSGTLSVRRIPPLAPSQPPLFVD